MFCPHCGSRARDDAASCPDCGKNLTSQVPAPQDGKQTTSSEVYIGGFFGLAKRRGLAYFADYGLFVTDKRLIIINKSVFPPHGWPVISKLRDEIDLTVNATPARLDELKKESQIAKGDVQKIQLSKPGLFRKGALVVTASSGTVTKLAFMDDADGIRGFETAKEILGRFAPERLELQSSGK